MLRALSRSSCSAARASRTPWRSECSSLGEVSSRGLETPSSLHRPSIILCILSGVIGNSLVRTPIASWTALQTAGRIGSSGPSPASLAPKGPSESFDSTMIGTISGISCTVGIL